MAVLPLQVCLLIEDLEQGALPASPASLCRRHELTASRVGSLNSFRLRGLVPVFYHSPDPSLILSGFSFGICALLMLSQALAEDILQTKQASQKLPPAHSQPHFRSTTRGFCCHTLAGGPALLGRHHRVSTCAQCHVAPVITDIVLTVPIRASPEARSVSQTV